MTLEVEQLRAQVRWYKGESERTTEALAMLTVYVPANIKYQREGMVSIPIETLVKARELARGPVGPVAEASG